MKAIDVIILTDSSKEQSLMRCKRTIRTLHDSELERSFYITVIDSAPAHNRNAFLGDVLNYECTYGQFNYNANLNKAFKYVFSQWVVISNDDVSYEKNWLTEIFKVHEQRPDIHSFSPKDPMLYALYYPMHFLGSYNTYLESYRVTEALQGWCLVIKKESLEKIAPLDEQFDMYYQDNDYAEMLKKHGIKHALCRHSIAVHLNTANISNPISPEKASKMAYDEKKFREKWKIFD